MMSRGVWQSLRNTLLLLLAFFVAWLTLPLPFAWLGFGWAIIAAAVLLAARRYHANQNAKIFMKYDNN
jgi:membrane protein implicated in regulation of membrane protease activity